MPDDAQVAPADQIVDQVGVRSDVRLDVEVARGSGGCGAQGSWPGGQSSGGASFCRRKEAPPCDGRMPLERLYRPWNRWPRS